MAALSAKSAGVESLSRQFKGNTGTGEKNVIPIAANGVKCVVASKICPSRKVNTTGAQFWGKLRALFLTNTAFGIYVLCAM